MNILKSYKIQSIVTAFMVVLFYIISIVCNRESGSIETKSSFDGPAMVSLILWLIFEIIIIPINILYIAVLNKIDSNDIKIYKNKELVFFSFISELLVILVSGLKSMSWGAMDALFLVYSIISVGIFILNIIRCFK